MVGVFLLFFFHYYHQNFCINFWCSIFFKKATQLFFNFWTIMFFWSKIIFDENFDVIYFFLKNYTKVVSFSTKQKTVWIRQSFKATSKTKSEVTHNKKDYEFLFALAKSRKWVCQKQKYDSFLRQDYDGRVGGGGVCLAPFTVISHHFRTY